VPNEADDLKMLRGLAVEIAQGWDKFEHGYLVRKKGKRKVQSSTGERWDCESLKRARERYRFKGLSGEKTRAILDPLSKRIRESITKENASCHRLHHLCLEVLEWGGVEGASSKWLRERCGDGSLAEQINSATELLATFPSKDPLDRFDGEDLVMNSGLTKIYALTKPDDVIIYDGRIGAAMGLLARRCCEKEGTKGRFKCGHGESAVPPVLQFPWGDGLGETGSRNPSVEPYVFPALRPGTARSNRIHASACRKASYVLRMAVDIIRKGGASVNLRDLEMALFMVGYAVATPTLLGGPFN
jgi:hypothetical protein